MLTSKAKQASRGRPPEVKYDRKQKRRWAHFVAKAIERKIETKTQLQIADAQQIGQFTGENKLIILCNDVFKTIQGVQDGIQTTSNANRVGDEISALGFVLRYRLTNQCLYTDAGGLKVTIPFVTYRIIVFVANASNTITGNPTKSEVLDWQHPVYSILPCEVPINKNGGLIKRVLLDKRITVNNHGLMVNNNTQNPTSLAGTSRDFKKYIKYPHKIRSCDSSDAQGAPYNDTMNPIYVCLIADAGVNMGAPTIPAATVGWCTGYCQAWFKDA